MSALLEVRHVSRVFRTTLAVDDVSFEVQAGELLGLIGRIFTLLDKRLKNSKGLFFR